ncbi:P-loop containing nucleoside triphosphate hydrolase protein, partial [Rhizophagus irregularis]
VKPPKYTEAPGFQFDLSVLCNDKRLTLNVANTHTYDDVALSINEYSRLDKSQAKALISALTREIALIEGPPGTGKTVVGIEIMKVLLAENNRANIGPILTICFTNHALDQFLEHLLDQNITKNIVRLGTRTKSERIKDFMLGKVSVKNSDIPFLMGALEDVENEVDEIKTSLKCHVTWNDVSEYLKDGYREFYNKFKIDSDDDEFFDEYDEIQYAKNYEKPNTDRPLDVLLRDYSIWRMSNEERQKLHNYWRAKLDEERLLNLQTVHEGIRQDLNDIYDEARRQILLNSDVIGMTTSGAAKFQNLIKYIDPKIIICEEAGEVLEAHILSALTPSTQHLILIGDHNQLRPHVATYSLSIESYKGENYQLDKSLFERLVDGKNTIRIEKTRLLTQRRMRKEISDLIRYTIYDDLEDGENTTEYPKIRGAQHNVYFIDHRNPEDKSNSDSAMQSHVNMFEVKMVVEMVKYFVKYGYTKPEDIAVLTPYLGQMIKIKEALSESFAVDIDERDAQDMDDVEEEKINTPKSLHQRVILRTVDNFQGEEANIVIISLVRNNSGNKYSSIGFLKSKNRSNVLLSRAREGMYLIGNSELMASKSEDMWATVVNILRQRNQVGPGMPIECKHHPNCKNIITKPGQFDEVCSPTGGCRSACDMPLSCGHLCTEECHFNNLDHIGVKCRKPCKKLHSECGHQCPKLCYKDCGNCNVPVGEIILPCGHTFHNAECWENKTKENIRCNTTIDIVLSDCGHPLPNIECWKVQSEMEFTCQFLNCGMRLECGHKCSNKCFKCQERSISQNSRYKNKIIERINHGKCRTKCNKLLYCGHMCEQSCHKGECRPCNGKCLVSCDHKTCSKDCLEPCAVCAKNCSWECKHRGKCELSCGIPCNRLPCNERCDKKAKCGHNCAGICGEICPTHCANANCVPKKINNQVSDIFNNIKFSKVDWNKEKMVALPCGHIYTMKSMDKLMGMKEYYEGSSEGGWISVKSFPTSTSIKKCPACQASIRDIRRYGRIIKKYTLETQNRKFMIKYDGELRKIAKRIIASFNEMKGGRNK